MLTMKMFAEFRYYLQQQSESSIFHHVFLRLIAMTTYSVHEGELLLGTPTPIRPLP